LLDDETGEHVPGRWKQVIAMREAHPHPHSVADLALAPVIIGLEDNLTRLRSSDDLESELAAELDDDASSYPDEADRVHRILKAATRNVNLHGWTVSPTPDIEGLAVSHGQHTISIMFGKQLANYIEHGTTTWP
jgi:hypothetical protein